MFKAQPWVLIWSKSRFVFYDKENVLEMCQWWQAMQSNNLLDLEDGRDLQGWEKWFLFRPWVAKLLRNMNLIEEASAAQWYHIIKSRNNCALCHLKISDWTREIWNHHSGRHKASQKNKKKRLNNIVLIPRDSFTSEESLSSLSWRARLAIIPYSESSSTSPAMYNKGPQSLHFASE